MTFAQQATVAGTDGLTTRVQRATTVAPRATTTPTTAPKTGLPPALPFSSMPTSWRNPTMPGSIPTGSCWTPSPQSLCSKMAPCCPTSSVRQSTEGALTNGGYQDSDMIGDFPNLGPVWFNKKSIAIILSFADVRRVCRITMDTGGTPEMCVHHLDGSLMQSRE